MHSYYERERERENKLMRNRRQYSFIHGPPLYTNKVAHVWNKCLWVYIILLCTLTLAGSPHHWINSSYSSKMPASGMFMEKTSTSLINDTFELQLNYNANLWPADLDIMLSNKTLNSQTKYVYVNVITRTRGKNARQLFYREYTQCAYAGTLAGSETKKWTIQKNCPPLPHFAATSRFSTQSPSYII